MHPPAPVVLGFMNSIMVDRTPGGPLAAMAMLAPVAWAVYVVFFLIKNDSGPHRRAGRKAGTA